MEFPKHMRVVVARKATDVRINSTVPQNSFDILFVDFTDAIAKALGFSYELLLSKDGEIGRRLKNGTWTGIVGMIQRNEADLGISDLSITTGRSEVVDFSYPYQRAAITFATRKPQYVPELTAFLGPFSSTVWILSVICLIVLPLVLYVLFQNKYPLCKLNWSIYGLFMRQTLNIKPKNLGEYLMLTCWMLSAEFLGYCYAAVLLSFLTFPFLKGASTIPELAAAVADGDYQCTSYRGTFLGSVLAGSTNPHVGTIGRNLLQNEGSNDVYAVLSDTKSSKIPAFVGAENHLRPLKEGFFVSSDEFISVLLGVAMQKDFCCKSQIDDVIGRIWSSGLYMKFSANRDYETASKILFHHKDIGTKHKIRQLTYDDVEGAFSLLIVGYVVATIVFTLEVIVKKFQLTKKSNIC